MKLSKQEKLLILAAQTFAARALESFFTTDIAIRTEFINNKRKSASTLRFIVDDLRKAQALASLLAGHVDTMVEDYPLDIEVCYKDGEPINGWRTAEHFIPKGDPHKQLCLGACGKEAAEGLVKAFRIAFKKNKVFKKAMRTHELNKDGDEIIDLELNPIICVWRNSMYGNKDKRDFIIGVPNEVFDSFFPTLYLSIFKGVEVRASLNLDSTLKKENK